MNREAWQATVSLWSFKESDTTEQLTLSLHLWNFYKIYNSFHCYVLVKRIHHLCFSDLFKFYKNRRKFFFLRKWLDIKIVWGYIYIYMQKGNVSLYSEPNLVVWVWLFVTPWIAACQAPLSMQFSRQEYCSGLPLASPIWKYKHV